MNRPFQFTLRTLMLLVVLWAALFFCLRFMAPLVAVGLFMGAVPICALMCLGLGPVPVKVGAVGFCVGASIEMFSGTPLALLAEPFFERFYPMLEVVQQTPVLIRTVSYRSVAMGIATGIIVSGAAGGGVALLVWYKLGMARLADRVTARWRRRR